MQAGHIPAGMQDEVLLPFPQNLPRVPRSTGGQDPAETWASAALGGCWLVRRQLHNHKTAGCCLSVSRG